jgi:hypothetical protein
MPIFVKGFPVREDNLADVVATATIAHTDARGTRWPLGAWATMNATTIGRPGWIPATVRSAQPAGVVQNVPMAAPTDSCPRVAANSGGVCTLSGPV